MCGVYLYKFANQTKYNKYTNEELFKDKEPTVPCNPPLQNVFFAEETKLMEPTKEPTVPRSNPPFDKLSFTKQTKEPFFCKPT